MINGFLVLLTFLSGFALFWHLCYSIILYWFFLRFSDICLTA